MLRATSGFGHQRLQLAPTCYHFLLFVVAQSSASLPNDPSSTIQIMNGSDSLLTTYSPPASDQKLLLLHFNWNNGTQWDEEFADTESDAFKQTAEGLKQKLSWLFDENPHVFSWDVVRLAKNQAALKVSANVRTTTSLSAEELEGSLVKEVRTQMKSEKKMVVSHIVVEELISINTFSNESSLPILPRSTMFQTSPLKTAMTSSQAISSVSTTPQMPTLTISESLDVSTGLPTENPRITTKPTIPSDAVKFLVSMTIDNLEYTNEMAYPNSTAFKKAAAEIEAVLYTYLCVTKLQGCIGITVIKLEKGSVIVIYNIHTSSSTKYKQSDVEVIVSDSAKNDELGHLQVSTVAVNKEEKDKETSSSSSGVFIYVLYGAVAMLVIALIILAVFKVRQGTT